jgi:hypothetical protein
MFHQLLCILGFHYWTSPPEHQTIYGGEHYCAVCDRRRLWSNSFR